MTLLLHSRISCKLVHILSDRRQKAEIKSYNTQNFCSNCGMITHRVPQGSILVPLFFIIYTNDLPPTINTLSEPIILADDTSFIISCKKSNDFHTLSNIVLCHMNKWFSANKLALNLDKANIIKSVTKSSPQHTLSIDYKEKCVDGSVNTKFLALKIDNCLNLKSHIDQLGPKLSDACYAVCSISHISNIDSLKSIYSAYFHSILKYGIIFWGNSCNRKKIH
jgi:hypothetical protein